MRRNKQREVLIRPAVLTPGEKRAGRAQAISLCNGLQNRGENTRKPRREAKKKRFVGEKPQLISLKRG